MDGLRRRYPWMGHTGRAALIGIAAAASAAALAVPALAGTTDLGSVSGIDYRARSNSSPVGPNGISIGPDAECAVDTRLVGGGVEIGGDFAESVINRSSSGDQSLAAPQSWVTVWANLAGASKAATVTSACMDRRVSRVRKARPIEGERTKGLEARCPAGTHVSSGGGWVAADARFSYINSSYPIDDGDPGHEPDDGWTIRVRNSTMSVADVTVEARCVEFHPLYRSAEPVSIDDGATIDVRMRCPRSAHVIGGGLRLAGAAWEAHPVTMTVDDGGDGDAIPDDRFLARAGNTAGTEHKQMTVYAVCKG